LSTRTRKKKKGVQMRGRMEGGVRRGKEREEVEAEGKKKE
jgi:hypothetical protein